MFAKPSLLGTDEDQLATTQPLETQLLLQNTTVDEKLAIKGPPSPRASLRKGVEDGGHNRASKTTGNTHLVVLVNWS